MILEVLGKPGDATISLSEDKEVLNLPEQVILITFMN